MNEASLDRLVDLVSARLDEDLSLHALSTWSGVSPHHLHREFKRHTGDTPAKFIARARLQRAAEMLVLQQAQVVEVALAVGYRDHATFSRAFRRFHSVSPLDYREQGRALSLGHPPGHRRTPHSYEGFQLSDMRLVHTRDLHIAYLRHVGPYEGVPDTLWADLTAALPSAALGAFIGIGLDPPERTPADELRFDAGVVLRQSVRVTPPVAQRDIPARRWVATLHAGAFSTLPHAYQQMLDRVGRSRDYRLDDGAPLEVYHSRVMASERALNTTEIYLPVVETRR